jgi:phage baseplate assembly protein W
LLIDPRKLGRITGDGMTEIIGTGLGFPLRVDRTGGLALVSGSDDINEAITLILSTAPGERPMRPNFGCGIHDYIFESVDSYVVGRLEREIRIAIDRWEPRIELRQITIDTSNAADGELPIELEYVVRATNDRRNLVYPFYVIPAEE